MEQRKRNALEVTCIGRPYQGPWEKKYWSSSRGKDRYPYPVGYQAVRCYNGHTYQMEVQEGVRGPLFMVSFGEGITCSGDTPTIAWQNALRKRNTHSRKAQHRLLNSNCNGSELFGFLNPLVQRLLRELVSSKGGDAHPDDEPEESSNHIGEELDKDKMTIKNKDPTATQARLSWGTSKSLLVRKSRTSIINSRNDKHRLDSLDDSVVQGETKESNTCAKVAKQTCNSRLAMQDEDDVSHLEGNHSPTGARKRLKLPKVTETTETLSQNNDLFCRTHPLPDANDVPPALLLGQCDYVQDISKKETNEGPSRVDCDSDDGIPLPKSHRNVGVTEHSVMVSDTLDEQPTQCCKEQPLQSCGLCVSDSATDLDKSDNSGSQHQDLNTLSRNEKTLKVADLIVPDSCDIDNVSMPLNCASISLDLISASSPKSLEHISVDDIMLSQKASTSLKDVARSFERSLEQSHGKSLEGSSGSIPVDTCNLDNGIPLLKSHRNASFTERTVIVPDTLDEKSSQCCKEQPLQICGSCVSDSPTNLEKLDSRGSQHQDLVTLIGNEKTLKLADVIVPDSCEIDNVSMPLNCASISPDPISASSPKSLEHISPGIMLSQKAATSSEGATRSLERSLEQSRSKSAECSPGSIPVDACKNSSHCSTTQNSQYSADNNENCESDSLGQELARSMITLLLPQAMQFLGNKKKRKTKPAVLPSIASDHVKPISMESHSGNHLYLPGLHTQAQLQNCTGNGQMDVCPVVDDLEVDAVFDKLMKSKGDGCLDAIIGNNVIMTDKAASECPYNCDLVDISNPNNSENGRCNASVDKISTKDFVPTKHKMNVMHDTAMVPDAIPSYSTMADSEVSESQYQFGNREGQNHSHCHVAEKQCQLSPQLLQVNNPIRRPTSANLDEFSPVETKDPSHTEHGNSAYTAPAESSCVEHSADVEAAALEVKNDLCLGKTVALLSPLNATKPHGHDAGKLLFSHFCSTDGKNSHLDSDIKTQERELQPVNLEPKACLEHPMPVLVMKLHVQDSDCRCLVLCGYPSTKMRVLFVYRITRKDFNLSLIKSINLNIIDCECDVTYLEHLETNGVCFTPDGQELVVLGSFCIQKTSVTSDPGSKKMMCFHGVKFVSYTDSEISVHTELSSFGRHVYSLLICGLEMVFAGGENGFVSGWKMDLLWRNHEESFILPVPPKCQLSHVIQLLAVPACPSLLVGCDNRSLMAIWNVSNRQFLQIMTLSNMSPLEVHVLSIENMNQQKKTHNEIKADSVKLSDGGGHNISVSLMLGVVRRSSSASVGSQTISRTWMLEFFQSPSCVSVFILDHERKRFSAMSIMDSLGVAGTEDGHVYIWDTANGSIKRAYKELEGAPIACIASNWTCDMVAVADMNARVMIYMRDVT